MTSGPARGKRRLRAGNPRIPLTNRLVMRLLDSAARSPLDCGMGVLRYTSRTGVRVALPVQVARDDDRVVVLAGDAAKKRWWRHFTGRAPVEVLLDGRWHGGTGVVVTGPESAAAEAYRRAHPRVALPEDATFVVITFPGPLPSTLPLRGRPLARAWFATVTLAEFTGFAVPACVGTFTAGMTSAVTVPALLVAGAVEGCLLGWGQAAVLSHALPRLRRRRWIAATAGAAALAYLIGLIPSIYGESMAAWPPVPLAIVVALLGTVLLASIGTAQWLVLRCHVRHAARWIPATTAAWTVGLGMFTGFTTPLWQPGQPLALTVTIGVAGGLLMAATTSAITGYALRHLLP
ncbi:hypothetical protein FHS43_006926 [Streptosporangium becharense]|uniref:DUF385 domain-containing protein n=1 Tax=Streptosporangium becharense TaxID=1816182 RepID=A0A7W9IBB8_9ACTN|nr:hypothetical protein [Streptosporangium becharense]MBB2915603.1 hypothetical protein [Streptosporangium becharense]MBB5817044.1 hypothetical protein [Streptosporangium becharense]